MRSVNFLAAGTLLVCVLTPAWAVPARSPVVSGDTLDAAAVHREYEDGNFESLTRTLEAFRTTVHRRQDSLVLAKFLGVMYAANHATIEKGKYWLYKMLEIDPRADIVDLYVTEDIHAALDRVRKELATRSEAPGGSPAVPAPAPAKPVPPVASAAPVTAKGPASTAPTSAAVNPSEGELAWNLDFGFGRKNLSTAWEPVSNQGALRIGFDLRPGRWRLNLTSDLILTTGSGRDSSGNEIQGGTSEILLGIRKFWEKPDRSWRPFVGTGLGFVLAERDTGATGTIQRSSPGIWLQGGLYWRLWRKWNLGFSGNYTIAGAKIRNKSTNPGSFTSALIFGYHH